MKSYKRWILIHKMKLSIAVTFLALICYAFYPVSSETGSYKQKPRERDDIVKKHDNYVASKATSNDQNAKHYAGHSASSHPVVSVDNQTNTMEKSVGRDATEPLSEKEKLDTHALKTVEPSAVNAGDMIKVVQDLVAEVQRLNEEVKMLKSNANPRGKDYPPVKFLNYRDRKRVLVTGGTGFVGSHLVDKLMEEGHEVVALDNHFTGRKRNVEHWIGHPNFELVHHDIVNPFFIEVDEVYHLASPASPPHYMYNPVKTIKTNAMGTINMLGLARRVKAKILLASTSEVYGDPEVHPQPETYWGHVNPVGPRSCYDEGKRVAEALMVAYNKQEDVDIRIARIFNTFGPRMHMNDGRVVSNFILQALQDQPISIYGSGNQTRSFQYVSDLVDGMMALMGSNTTVPVNLGNPEEHTIKQFAAIIQELTKSKSEIVYAEKQVDDPQQRKPDISRAWTLLKWKPRVSMVDGLKRTAEYFRKELEHNRIMGGSLIDRPHPLEYYEAEKNRGM